MKTFEQNTNFDELVNMTEGAAAAALLLFKEFCTCLSLLFCHPAPCIRDRNKHLSFFDKM